MDLSGSKRHLSASGRLRCQHPLVSWKKSGSPSLHQDQGTQPISATATPMESKSNSTPRVRSYI